jgi:hypothetical protein
MCNFQIIEMLQWGPNHSESTDFAFFLRFSFPIAIAHTHAEMMMTLGIIPMRSMSSISYQYSAIVSCTHQLFIPLKVSKGEDHKFVSGIVLQGVVMNTHSMRQNQEHQEAAS